MIQFISKELMFKKTVNQMIKSNVPDVWDTVSMLDLENNLISYHSSYSQEFENSLDNGIFLVLAVMEYVEFENAKVIEFGKRDCDEFCREFIVSTKNHRNIFSIPETQCPDYVSPEFFGAKIRKIDDEYEITYGLTFKKEYEIIFDKGWKDIEVVYADEIEKAAEYEKIPAKFIPFNENDDIWDKFSINNLINPTLVRFMHDSLSFK